MYFDDGAYKQVIATIEKSQGNDSVGDMWIETKSFDRKTQIEDIISWANKHNCSGRLIITIDQRNE